MGSLFAFDEYVHGGIWEQGDISLTRFGMCVEVECFDDLVYGIVIQHMQGISFALGGRAHQSACTYIRNTHVNVNSTCCMLRAVPTPASCSPPR